MNELPPYEFIKEHYTDLQEQRFNLDMDHIWGKVKCQTICVCHGLGDPPYREVDFNNISKLVTVK